MAKMCIKPIIYKRDVRNGQLIESNVLDIKSYIYLDEQGIDSL